MTNNIDDLYDIYRALPEGTEGSDTIGNIPPELEHQLRHYRILSAFLGILCVFLFLSLAVLLDRKTHKSAALSITPPAANRFVPKHTLPDDDLWVLGYQKASGGQVSVGGSGDKPVSTKWVKNAAYHVIVGQQALAVKDYEKAAIHFQQALKVFPEIIGVHGLLGTAYIQQQQFEAAVPLLKQAVDEEQSLSAISNLGIALLATERLEEAEEILSQALALHPEHPGVHKNLALLYRQTDRPEKALQHFETYFSFYQEDYDAAELYAYYLLDLDQEDRATAFLRDISQQAEDALPLYLLLAKIEARSTNDVQAVEALKNITRYISPNLAITKMNLKDFDTIRDSEAFRNLLHQTELAMVTLENQP